MSEHKITRKSSILVVDDDQILCKILEEFFSDHQYTVHLLNSGDEIERFLTENAVNLVILDVLLPGRDGLHWLSLIKQHHPSLPVLMLSALKTADDRIAGLQLGAKDYLTKPFKTTELLLRVKNLLESSRSLANQEESPHQFLSKQAVFIKQGQPIRLTTTEVKLLKFLYGNANKIMTRDEISQALRGNQHNPLDRSIDVHINRLRNKIEENPSTPKLLNTVWGKGYRFIKPDGNNNDF